MKNNLIEIKNLTKKFAPPKGETTPLYALKNIHLTIPQGSIYGIIGMSGAGKSTLLRCLTGLDVPSEGSILFEGKEFQYKNQQGLKEFRKQMGMIFQHFHLFSSRTVIDNIAYPLEIAGVPTNQRHQRAKELLALIGMESKKNQFPCQLSGGEKQRVGIARALVSHPRLLLCDEPTSALDPKTTRDLLQLLSTLNQQLQLTIVIITHQLEAVKQVCQRVAVLAQGQIVEEGDVKDIFMHPKHSVTKHLLHLNFDDISSDLSHHTQNEKCFIRLGFEGHQAKKPVLSYMLKHFDVEANILSGGLDHLHETVVGHLFIELSGNMQEVERALSFLRSQHITCEVLK